MEDAFGVTTRVIIQKHYRQFRARGPLGLRRRAGLTIVETVFALGIFGMVILGSYALIVLSMRTVRNTQEEIYVSRLLDSVLEEVRHLSWTEVTAQAATQDIPTTYPIIGMFGKAPNPAAVDDPSYARQLNQPVGTLHIETYVTPQGATEAKMRKVTAEIAWVPYGRSTGARTLKSTTLVSENGINRR